MHKAQGFTAAFKFFGTKSIKDNAPGQLYKLQLSTGMKKDAFRLFSPWLLFILASRYNELKAPFLLLLGGSYTLFRPQLLQSSITEEKRYLKLKNNRIAASNLILKDTIASLALIKSKDATLAIKILESSNPFMTSLVPLVNVIEANPSKFNFLLKDKSIIQAYATLHAFKYSLVFPKTRLLQKFSFISQQDKLLTQMNFMPTTAYNMLTERTRELGVVEPYYVNSMQTKPFLPIGWTEVMLRKEFSLLSMQIKTTKVEFISNIPLYGSLLTILAASKHSQEK